MAGLVLDHQPIPAITSPEHDAIRAIAGLDPTRLGPRANALLRARSLARRLLGARFDIRLLDQAAEIVPLLPPERQQELVRIAVLRGVAARRAAVHAKLIASPLLVDTWLAAVRPVLVTPVPEQPQLVATLYALWLRKNALPDGASRDIVGRCLVEWLDSTEPEDVRRVEGLLVRKPDTLRSFREWVSQARGNRIQRWLRSLWRG